MDFELQLERIPIEGKLKAQITTSLKHGVYFLFNQNELVYIGASQKDVLGRVWTHSYDKTKTFTHYSILDCEKSECFSIEEHYLFKYCPVYNKGFNRNHGIKSIGFIDKCFNVTGEVRFCVIGGQVYIDLNQLINICELKTKSENLEFQKNKPSLNNGKVMIEFWKNREPYSSQFVTDNSNLEWRN